MWETLSHGPGRAAPLGTSLSVPLARTKTTCCAGGVEGAGDPITKSVERQTDLRGVLAGVLIALLVASLALPVGGEVVTGGVARRLTLPAEPEMASGPRAGGVPDRRGRAPPANARTVGVGAYVRRKPPHLGARTKPARSCRAGPARKSIDPTAIQAWTAAIGEIGPVLEVTAVAPKSIAERAGLQIGDAVVTINGIKPDIHTIDGNLALGTTLTIRVYRDGHVVDLDLKPAAPWPQASGGGATYARRPITAPAPALSVGKVTGGSAGLVLALAYIDMLTVGDLTGHRLVAATGALGPGGSVGQVLGYDAKVTAATKAGASVFLMPRPTSTSPSPTPLRACESSACRPSTRPCSGCAATVAPARLPPLTGASTCCARSGERFSRNALMPSAASSVIAFIVMTGTVRSYAWRSSTSICA